MEVFLTIINFFKTIYATYLELTFNLLAFILPNDYVLFILSILTNMIFIGFAGSYLYGTFLNTFKHIGMIVFIFIISFIWVFFAKDTPIFLNGELINGGTHTLFISILGMFSVFSLNGRLNIVSSGIKRSRE